MLLAWRVHSDWLGGSIKARFAGVDGSCGACEDRPQRSLGCAISVPGEALAGEAIQAGLGGFPAGHGGASWEDGELERRLGAVVRLDEQGRVPPVQLFKTVLQACTKRKALAEARQVHGILAKHGLEGDKFLSNFLVTTLIGCGGFADGVELFGRLGCRTVLSWTAIISGYSNGGRWREALACFEKMQEEGVEPDKYTFVSLLKACSRLEDLDEGRRIHMAAVDHGFGSDVFVGSTLVSMYAKCGSIADAQKVFDGLSQRNVVSWNAMLAAYAHMGLAEGALEVYGQMQEEGVGPDGRTFVSVLQACGSLAEMEEGAVVEGKKVKVVALTKGREVHAEAARKGFEADVFVANTLVSMYAKCGSMVDAQQVFDRLSYRTVVSWTAMVAACVQQDQGERGLQIYHQMKEAGCMSNSWTLVNVLKACSSIAERDKGELVEGQRIKVSVLWKGKELHAEVKGAGLASDAFVLEALIRMYVKCCSIRDAQQVFDEFPNCNEEAWTAMLAAYAQQGQGERVLRLFYQMRELGVRPSAQTFVLVLQACRALAAKELSSIVCGQALKVQLLQLGKEIHAAAVSMGFGANLFVGSSLITMYARCGSLAEAQQAFDRLPKHDRVSWTALLTAYAQHCQGEKALQTYLQMKEQGFKPDGQTFVGVLQACAALAEKEVSNVHGVKLESLRKGRELHSEAVRMGWETNVFVGTALISMYAKCGCIPEAEEVFERLSQHNVVSWTAMIAAYTQHDQGEKALQLYGQMQGEGMIPEETTYLSVLEACSRTGAIGMCLQIHRSILQRESECSHYLTNSLIHAYGKCGSMVDARRVFDSLAQPDVVSWNALIAGYARLGGCETSIRCFEEMCDAGVEPDGVTFMALILGCSHACMVDKGLKFFESMTRDYEITADLDHYVSMIDLVGRAGLFTKAEDLLREMPMQPDFSVWLCLLGACRNHSNMMLGRHCFNLAISLEPTQAAPYVLMSNIYAQLGRWDSAKEIDGLRQRAGVRKTPGQTWIEHEEIVHTFLVGDEKHPHTAQLYAVLEELNLQLEKVGYLL